MDFIKIVDALIAALYFCGAAVHVGGAVAGRARAVRAGAALTLCGFAMHTGVLGVMLAVQWSAELTRSDFYFSLLAWSLLLIFFVLWWRLSASFLGLVAAPLALILFVSSMALGGGRLPLPPALSGLFFGLHIGALFTAIGLLAMACAAGAAYIAIDHKIKAKEKLSGFFKTLPPLSTFDRMNRLAVSAGFPLYTLGLLSGFIWAGFTWGKTFSWDPKEVAAIFIWLLYAFLFHQRVMLGWQGRKTAWMVIWVFGLTLASMIGINFLLPTHHSFKS
ncbi:MAG: cytochrome c biogenesis protein CcsA [Desulfovibrionaceae bacterium]|nr:cytochrome c biogenesis protein CcsA [Desulfovibrionaceae bacterium]